MPVRRPRSSVAGFAVEALEAGDHAVARRRELLDVEVALDRRRPRLK